MFNMNTHELWYLNKIPFKCLKTNMSCLVKVLSGSDLGHVPQKWGNIHLLLQLNGIKYTGARSWAHS